MATNRSSCNGSRSSGEVADWERQLASTINDISRRCAADGSQRGSYSRAVLPVHIPPPPPAAAGSGQRADAGDHAGGLSHRSAAVASFHATRGVGATRPVPKSVLADITDDVRRSVERLIDDKLAATERTADIMRGQAAALSDDLTRTSREVGTANHALASHERVLDALRHEVNGRRAALARLESFSADETAWRNAVNSDVALLKQKSARHREDIQARATTAELKAALDSVHVTATSSVAAAVSPVRDALRGEMEAMRRDVVRLRQDHARMKEELDAVGIAGSSRLGAKSLNDGIKAVVAHAVAIHSSEVESNLKRDLRKSVDARMNEMREEIKHSSKSCLTAEDTEALISRIVMRAVDGAQSDMEASILKHVDSKIGRFRDDLPSVVKQEVGRAEDKGRVSLAVSDACMQVESKIQGKISMLERDMRSSIDDAEFAHAERVKKLMSTTEAKIRGSEENILSQIEKTVCSNERLMAHLANSISEQLREDQVFVCAARDEDISSALDACSQHNDKLTNLCEDIKRMKDTHGSVTEQVVSLQENAKDLDKQLVEVNARLQMTLDTTGTGLEIVKALGGRIQKLEEAASSDQSLTNRIVKLEDMCQSYEHASSKSEDRYSTLNREVLNVRSNLEDTVVAMQNDFDHRSEKSKSDIMLALRAVEENITAVSDELKIELGHVLQKLNMLDEARSSADTKMSKLEKEFGNATALDIRLTSLEKERNVSRDLGERLFKVEAARSEMRGVLSSLQEAVGSVSDSLLREVSALKQTLCSLQETSAHHNRTLGHLKDQIRVTNDSLQACTTLPSRVEALESSIEALKIFDSVDSLREMVTELEATCGSNEKAQTSLESQVTTIDSTLRELQARVDKISSCSQRGDEGEVNSEVLAQLGALEENVNLLSERIKNEMNEKISLASDMSFNRLQELKEKVATLEETVTRTFDALSKVEQMCEAREEGDADRSEKSALLSSVQEAVDSVSDSLQREVSALKQTLCSLQETSADHDGTLGHLKDQMRLANDSQRACTTLSSRVQALESSIEALKICDGVDSLRETVTKLEATCGCNEKAQTSLESQVKNIATSIQLCDSTLMDLQARVDKISSCSQRGDEGEVDSEVLGQLGALEENVNLLSERLENEMKKVSLASDTSSNRLQELKEKVATLEETVARTFDALSKVEQMCKAREEGDAARSEESALFSSVQEAVDSVSDSLQREVSALKQSLCSLQETSAHHNGALGHLQDQIRLANHSQQACTTLSSRVEALESSIEALKICDGVDSLRETVTKLEATCGCNEKAQTSLESQVKNIATSIQLCDSTLGELQARVDKISSCSQRGDEGEVDSEVLAQLGALEENVNVLSERLENEMSEKVSLASDISSNRLQELKEKVATLEETVASTLDALAQIQRSIAQLTEGKASQKECSTRETYEVVTTAMNAGPCLSPAHEVEISQANGGADMQLQSLSEGEVFAPGVHAPKNSDAKSFFNSATSSNASKHSIAVPTKSSDEISLLTSVSAGVSDKSAEEQKVNTPEPQEEDAIENSSTPSLQGEGGISPQTPPNKEEGSDSLDDASCVLAGSTSERGDGMACVPDGLTSPNLTAILPPNDPASSEEAEPETRSTGGGSGSSSSPSCGRMDLSRSYSPLVTPVRHHPHEVSRPKEAVADGAEVVAPSTSKELQGHDMVEEDAAQHSRTFSLHLDSSPTSAERKSRSIDGSSNGSDPSRERNCPVMPDGSDATSSMRLGDSSDGITRKGSDGSEGSMGDSHNEAKERCSAARQGSDGSDRLMGCSHGDGRDSHKEAEESCSAEEQTEERSHVVLSMDTESLVGGLSSCDEVETVVSNSSNLESPGDVSGSEEEYSSFCSSETDVNLP